VRVKLASIVVRHDCVELLARRLLHRALDPGHIGGVAFGAHGSAKHVVDNMKDVETGIEVRARSRPYASAAIPKSVATSTFFKVLIDSLRIINRSAVI
jgi:hypothetical protein